MRNPPDQLPVQKHQVIRLVCIDGVAVGHDRDLRRDAPAKAGVVRGDEVDQAVNVRVERFCRHVLCSCVVVMVLVWRAAVTRATVVFQEVHHG